MEQLDKAKFTEKLTELLEMGKKKKNVLEYQEINDFFQDMPLTVEQLEKVFDYLEAHNIDVLRITENDADTLLLPEDEDIDLENEEEVDMENLDLSVPEGISMRIRSACI